MLFVLRLKRARIKVSHNKHSQAGINAPAIGLSNQLPGICIQESFPKIVGLMRFQVVGVVGQDEESRYIG